MVIVITGPTCTGKSSAAIKLAQEINGEIINADAFQVYKELNIGVAKISEKERECVKHHLFDIKSISENYSIADYQKDCRLIINSIIESGKTPILVGGSGLYIKAALYDYDFSNERIEMDLSHLDKLSNNELHNLLVSVDAISASQIHFNNRKRVLRALDIFYTSGTTKSEIIDKQEKKLVYDSMMFAFDVERETLYKRINSRVDEMIDKGLIKEIQNIEINYDITKCKQALSAIGYKEFLYNDNNLSNIDCVELVKKNTRNYAKRQVTFFKHQMPVKFISDYDIMLNFINNRIMSERSRKLIGDDFEKLTRTSVCIIGIGGVGGTCLEALVRSGVSNIQIVDYDTVDNSNLNRQILFTNNDIGKSKVECAFKRIKSINPLCNITTLDKKLDKENIDVFNLCKFDFIVDAIDCVPSKIALIKYLVENNLNFISCMGTGKKMDPKALKITTLNKTNNDPLARKIRYELKQQNVNINDVEVVFSDELPLNNDKVVSSMIFVPSTAGLLIANHLLKKI